MIELIDASNVPFITVISQCKYARRCRSSFVLPCEHVHRTINSCAVQKVPSNVVRHDVRIIPDDFSCSFLKVFLSVSAAGC